MCGIAVSVNINNIDINRVHKYLRHRGPDGEGSYIYNNVTLIHNRLAIQDLSENASQPMLINEHVIIFNGEIYNHIELRTKLKEYKFKSSSDTETLLYLFIKYGVDCLKELDGMFAVVIYNKKSGKIFFARDRAGKKPLYYYSKNNQYFFASELNVIRKNINLEINNNNINSFLRFGYFYKKQTPYKDVYELEAGSYAWLNINNMDLMISKWWNIEDYYQKNNLDIEMPEAMEKVDSYLNLSIKRRLQSSDLEVGSFLSGGIDSG